MNTSNEILAALKLLKTKENTGYCSTLANICKLIIELKKDSSFSTSIGSVITAKKAIEALPDMPKELHWQRVSDWQAQRKKTINNINMFEARQTLTFATKTGTYSVDVPTNNKFYSYIMSLCGIAYEVAPAEKELTNCKNRVIVSGEVIEKIKIAAKFVGKDTLRPAMMHVCVDVRANGVRIAATDANKMYYTPAMPAKDVIEDLPTITQRFNEPINALQILIPADVVSKFPKKFDSNYNVSFDVFENNTCKISGYGIDITFDMFDHKTWGNYPDYLAVIPNYSEYMQFDRVQFIDLLKNVLPAADRTTNQVKLHLNGQIDMSCKDVDFETESKAYMYYNSKNFKDVDIAFNGKLLQTTLKYLPGKNIKMWQHGENTRSAIFEGENSDCVLVMPQRLND